MKRIIKLVIIFSATILLSSTLFGQSRSIPVKFYDKGVEKKIDSCLTFKLITKQDTIDLMVSNGFIEIPKVSSDSVELVFIYKGIKLDSLRLSYEKYINNKDIISWTFGMLYNPFPAEVIESYPYYSHLPKLFYWEFTDDNFITTWFSSFSEDLEIEDEPEEESYVEISMADFFEKDTVSLYINNTVVFYKKELNSDFSVGLTGDEITLFKRDKGGIIEYNYNRIDIPLLSDLISIKVCVNGECKEYVIDIEKGKYLSIDKISDNEVKILQSRRMIEYE